MKSHDNFRNEIYNDNKDDTPIYFLLAMGLIAFIIITSWMGLGDQVAVHAGYIN